MSRSPLLFILVSLANLALTSPSSAQSYDPYSHPVYQAPSPYWGYYRDPYGSALHGVAAIIQAQGQYLINRQEAVLLREKTKLAKLETGKKVLEQWEWRREFLFDAAIREKKRQDYMEMNRSEEAPMTEVYSGKALSYLATKLPYEPVDPANSVKVEPEWLKHIRIGSEAGGNLGLLLVDKLPWPIMMRTTGFEADRIELERLFSSARNGAANDGASTEVIISLRSLLKNMEAKANAAISSWSDNDSMKVTRFLRELNETVKQLEQPDTAFYLTPLQGRTVAELVDYMKKRGVKTFGPATAQDTRQYRALHDAFVAEIKRVRKFNGGELEK